MVKDLERISRGPRVSSEEQRRRDERLRHTREEIFHILPHFLSSPKAEFPALSMYFPCGSAERSADAVPCAPARSTLTDSPESVNTVTAEPAATPERSKREPSALKRAEGAADARSAVVPSSHLANVILVSPDAALFPSVLTMENVTPASESWSRAMSLRGTAALDASPCGSAHQTWAAQAAEAEMSPAAASARRDSVDLMFIEDSSIVCVLFL